MIYRLFLLFWILLYLCSCTTTYTMKDCMREYPILLPKDQCNKYITKNTCKEKFQLLEKEECPVSSTIVKDILNKCLTKKECLELCRRRKADNRFKLRCDECSKRCGLVCDISIPTSLKPVFKFDKNIPKRLILSFPIKELKENWILDFSYSIRGCLRYDYISTCSYLENCERKFENGFRILYNKPCLINYWLTLKDINKKCGVAIQNYLILYHLD